MRHAAPRQAIISPVPHQGVPVSATRENLETANGAGIPADLRDALAGRYTLERELGQGGMATVYLAHDVRHERPVALKVLRAEQSAAARRRAVRAGDQSPRAAAASVRSPASRFGRSRRRSLFRHAVRRGRIAPRQDSHASLHFRWRMSSTIVRQIADALDYATVKASFTAT